MQRRGRPWDPREGAAGLGGGRGAYCRPDAASVRCISDGWSTSMLELSLTQRRLALGGGGAGGGEAAAAGGGARAGPDGGGGAGGGGRVGAGALTLLLCLLLCVHRST